MKQKRDTFARFNEASFIEWIPFVVLIPKKLKFLIVYLSIPKNGSYDDFVKKINWLRLQFVVRLIYNCGFAKVKTEIHIHIVLEGKR
ncbi:hypothetical protein [Bacillus sp. FJAT-53711]|uniref:hypothetical protein n=1 Tax=Bacillus yunxiaonensis TaxID=3127665 RepID=UPI0030140CCC